MRVPNCRTSEDYNQKLLRGDDKEFIRGYDWCNEYGVDNFFNNLEILDDDYLMKVLNEKLPEHHDLYGAKYDYYYMFVDLDDEERTIETYADLIRAKIAQWIESERDMIITSFIDKMSDDEYAKAKEEMKRMGD